MQEELFLPEALTLAKPRTMDRSVVRKLPDGSTRSVDPYHVCLKGLETAVLCRDEEDYDVMVKVLAVCAWRNNVIIITYSAVSNHTHTAALAVKWKDAQAFGEDCKKVYSMYFQRKYGEEGILRRVKVKALWLDNPFHLRNTLAYIPRNALDNGGDIADYPWSGHKAMFRSVPPVGMPVSTLTKRERRKFLHTDEKLKGVPWLLDGKGQIIPQSICDHAYLEQVFNGDPAYYLKTIGGVNVAEMRYLLEEKPYVMQPDSEFYKMVNETSLRWFSTDLSALSLERKLRIIPYIYRTAKTTIAQLARIFGLDQTRIASIVGKDGKEGKVGKNDRQASGSDKVQAL